MSPEEQPTSVVLRLPQDQLINLFTSGKARILTTSNEPHEPVNDIVKVESEAWQSFLGRSVEVTSPPAQMLEVQKRAKDQGTTTLEPHFLPNIPLQDGTGPLPAPGWIKKPNDWYWEQIKNGKVDKEASKLNGVWVLVDKSQKPNYESGQQLYESDPLADLISKLRLAGKIQKTTVPETSRFSISWDELNGTVLPELAGKLGVSKGQVRLPKAIEFNALGNMHHPEWGDTSTWEWFEDKFEGDSRLVGGRSGDGGLADVNWLGHVVRDDGIGFRPLIVFSS